MQHVYGRREICVGFLWGNMKGRGELEDLSPPDSVPDGV